MSTSTSEKGQCRTCGHAMGVHTSSKRSKCKKCRKRFIICQALRHGHQDHSAVNPMGWRICYRPCSCGTQYYPDHALGATELQPWEYKIDHEGYRPVEEFFGEDGDSTMGQMADSNVVDCVDDQARPNYPDKAETAVREDEVGVLTNQLEELMIQDETAVFVEAYRKGKRICFFYNSVEYKTSLEEWEWIESAEGGGYMACHREEVTFWIWEFPGEDGDQDYNETRKGKEKAKGRKSEGKEKGKYKKEKEKEKGKSKGKEKAK